MNDMTFKASTGPSMGVELELQLVRAHDYDLAHEAGDLLVRLGKRKLKGEVKPEITQSMIELNTSVHLRHAGLRAELEEMREAVAADAGMLNLRVSGGGAHPFHDWNDRRIYQTERFEAFLERYGYLAKQFTVFGQHVHLGCPDGDAAVYLVHVLTRYVPHFIALSAASPFYQGRDTSFQSSRLTAISAFPLAGHMPFVPDWEAFVGYFRSMQEYGVAASMKDFYWDIRPKPEYGTVEIRVFDTPLSVARAAQLAAYAQAIAAWHLAERPRQPAQEAYLVNGFNRFEACRFGYRGEMIDAWERRKKMIGEDILDTVAMVMPHARHLECAEALAQLAGDVRRDHCDADWLRARLSQAGSLADVVRAASDRWAAAD